MWRTLVGIRLWIEAARPKTLMAGICPVILGTALAFSHGKMHVPSALAALLGSVAIQVGTNYANDYFDFKKGADTEQRKGPRRVTAAGLVAPRAMLFAMAVAFFVAFIAGLFVVYRGGLPLVVIGLLSILCGILYTGGPYPLGYNGLGDIFVLIFFGPVAVGGTYFIQANDVSTSVLMLGLAPGLIATGILAVNNLRDCEEDRTTGKRTLAVRFGPNFAKLEYAVCIVMPLIITFYLGKYVWEWAYPAVCFLALPYGIILIRKARTEVGQALNEVLAKTGVYLLVYTLFALSGMVL